MTLQDAIHLFAPDGILHLASRDRRERIAQLTSEPFDPEVHYTMAYIHLHYAMLEEAKSILDFCPDKNDETYKELEDLYNALDECQRSNFGIFPLSVRYRDWWDGPHLFADKSKILAWFPIKVNYIDGDDFYAVTGKKVGDKIVYGSVKLPCSIAAIPPEPDMMGEYAICFESRQVAFHTDKVWKHNPALRVVIERAMPYMVRSNETLQQRIEEDLYERQ